MATTIVTKYGSDAPAASDIVRGELAVDTENGRLYTENSSGAVVEIGLNPEGNVDVTGSVTADGLTVDGNATISNATNPKLEISDTTLPNTLLLQSLNGDSIVGTSSNTSLALKTNNLSRIGLANNGDISFYEDTGTTAKFFWDASAESLGIGTTSPTGLLHLAADNAHVISKVMASTTGYDAELWLGRNDTRKAIIKAEQLSANSDHDLVFFTNAASADATEKVRITSAGDVSFANSGGIIKAIGSDVSLVQGAIGLRINDAASALSPTTASANNDASVDLGVSNIRFKDLYLSGGVYVGGTAAANKLDDYEEGTFTPTVTTSSGTLTYSVQTGSYVKIGDVVYYWIRVTVTNSTTATLHNVESLPFSTTGYSLFYAGPTISNAYDINLGTDGTVLGGYYLNSASAIRLHSYGNNTGQLAPSVAAGVAFELRLEGHYRTTA